MKDMIRKLKSNMQETDKLLNHQNKEEESEGDMEGERIFEDENYEINLGEVGGKHELKKEGIWNKRSERKSE